jgi:transposase
MVGKKRRKFTSEFRSQIVLEVLSGKVSVAQAAKKYKIKDGVIYEWRKHALESFPLLFDLKVPQQEGSERVAELERLIGQLTVENEALKKASRWLSRASTSGEPS